MTHECNEGIQEMKGKMGERENGKMGKWEDVAMKRR